jgi:signal transduction histidine kinase
MQFTTDPDRLKIIMINLLKNSFKDLEEKIGEVHVKVE